MTFPSHWMTASGKEVFTFVTSGSRGWAQHYSDEGAAFIRIGNLDHNTLALDLKALQRVRPPNGAEGARTRLQHNDILISITAELGMIGLVPDTLGEAYINQHLALARPSAHIQPRFVAWYLASQADGKAQLLAATRGATKASLGLDDIRSVSFPVPPMAEQKRIADKLDTLHTRVEACRDRLDRVPPLLKRFRQAVYEAASSGSLTEDWRVERARGSDDWSSTTVEEVATLVFDGPFGSNLKSSDYTEAGIRVVRLENIAPLRFIEDKRTYIAAEKFQALARHTLLADDVLFSSFVDEEVRVCLLPPELSGKAINKADCFCIRVDSSRCHPRFLALKLASRSTFSALDDVIHGATRPRINLGQLRAIAFHLPSIDEQTEIVQRVDSLFSVATAIESRLTAARAKVDRLTPALLAKAFTGELVPQDSDEEPAANLLARIRDHSESGEADRPKRSLSQGSRTKAKLVADMLTRNNVATTHLTDILKERGALTAEALWKASQLEIDDFYDQLKDEESKGLLRENRGDTPNSPRLLESAA